MTGESVPPVFRDDPLIRAETDKIKELISNTNLSLLIGAGCSKCAGLPLMPQLTQDICDCKDFCNDTKDILSFLRVKYKYSSKSNIEDFISELIDYLSIIDRRPSKPDEEKKIKIDETQFTEKQISFALVEIKNKIASYIEGNKISIGTHKKFINHIHKSLQKGKQRENFKIDYYVLNYDTLVEDALSLEQIRFCDGFHGGATGWWDPESLKKNEDSVRVLKIHGSIDWCLFKDEIFPRRVRRGILSDEPIEKVMIWPASTKYRETQRDPYAQMINIMKENLHPSSHQHLVLIICGYSFGDSHINYEIEKALRESDHLTLIILSSDDEPIGILKKWRDDPTISDQVVILANKGFFHGGEIHISDRDLPWWQFEIFTKIIRSE
jgi:hypothetical protein